MINQMAKQRSAKSSTSKRVSGKTPDILKLVLPKIPGKKPGKSVEQLLHELRYGS